MHHALCVYACVCVCGQACNMSRSATASCIILRVCVCVCMCGQVRNMMSMALCLADGGGTKAADTAEAGRILQRAYDLAAQNKLFNIQKEVAMLQVGDTG